MSRISNYQSFYYDKLLTFCKKTWKNRKYADEYLNYRLVEISNNPSDIEQNLLVVNDDDEIVGCNLFIPAKAMISDKEQTIYWSHDTIIEEKYRGDIGMELMLRVNTTKRMFGFGLSPIAEEISRKLKNNFIAKVTVSFIFNRWSIKALLYKVKILSDKTHNLTVIPDTIKVKENVFELVKKTADVSIPNDGYWNRRKLDIEMCRNADFLKHRFFDNFKTYYFYQNKAEGKKSYFVVRKIVWLGIPVVSLVDFRCDLENLDEYRTILRAVNKIAVKNKLPLSVTRSTVFDRKIGLFPLTISRVGKSAVVTNIKNIQQPSVFITLADSDADLLQ